MGDSTHVTNCCANSHDASKFAGEICANLTATKGATTSCGQPIVPLGKYFPAFEACLLELATKTFPFVQGGVPNGGFEYLGIDFMLSNDGGKHRAYILEVNAPPSQDTATGLQHAEDLHSRVIKDLLSLWVIPRVTGALPVTGGWHHVKQANPVSSKEESLPSPSSAALLNKIRWALKERKLQKEQERRSIDRIAERAQMHFEYFARKDCDIFFENAGGTQVPRQVIRMITTSLQHRHRDRVGLEHKEAARSVISKILGGRNVFFGQNASSLFRTLAYAYRMNNFCTPQGEILVSTENHLANIQPWEELAAGVGCALLWWDPAKESLTTLVSNRTRIVAISQASNILGNLRDVDATTKEIRGLCGNQVHIVVDGVAAAPHVYADFDNLDVDWYVSSTHKIFGPHLGVLCASDRGLSVLNSDLLEVGTISYEACAGIRGLGEYWCSLGSESNLSTAAIRETYRQIGLAEKPVLDLLLKAVSGWEKVTVLEGGGHSIARLPVISVQHASLKTSSIVEACDREGIICRQGYFLCSAQLRESIGKPVVRFSFVHYNTTSEVQKLIHVLEAIPGWI